MMAGSVTAEHENVPNIMLRLDLDRDRLVQVMVRAPGLPAWFAFSFVRTIFEQGGFSTPSASVWPVPPSSRNSLA
jgi:hypothetical protein